MSSWTALSYQFIEGLLLGGGVVLLIWAALHDLAARTVPNGLPVAVALAGCGLRALDHSLMAGLAASGTLFAVLFALWSAHAIGGGDVKLWSASVLLVPAHWQIEVDCLTRILLAGGALGLLYLLLRPVVAHWRVRAYSTAFIPIRENADWYARGVGGAAARETKALCQPATCPEESINWRAGAIPIRENADWYARGVGGAAARETKALCQPATCPEESINWRAGVRAGLLSRVLRAEAWRIARKAPLPYALAIAGGTIFTLLPPNLPSAFVALR